MSHSDIKKSLELEKKRILIALLLICGRTLLFYLLITYQRLNSHLRITKRETKRVSPMTCYLVFDLNEIGEF